VLELRDDALQVLLAREAEELHAVPLDMLGVQHDGRLLRANRSQEAFPFD